MPLHTWHCDGCGRDLDILRTVGNHAEPPTTEEVADAQVPETCPSEVGHQSGAKPHLWRKVLRGAPGAVRGAGWGPGRKGHW